MDKGISWIEQRCKESVHLANILESFMLVEMLDGVEEEEDTI